MARHLAIVFTFLLSDAAAAQDAVTVDIMESEEYGQFLAIGERPVYLFSSDTQGMGGTPPVVSCIGECQAGWPPVAGPAEAGEGVSTRLLGTVEVEGDAVVTYNGWPLYHFERDIGGGPPTGQEFESFGGSWLLIGPDGAPILGQGV